MELDTILKTALDLGSSDIHLISGHPPMARVHTTMTPLDYPVITPEGAMRMLKAMATEDLMRFFDKILDSDFSFEIPCLGRFR
ncbi:MAG: type IV pili twitching motility protein PilT, partial [Planctomycetota bacterium]